jgi:cysteinyl-tRNA synthetase
VEEQEPNPLKEDPRDFALWKATKPEEDTSWDSPWGAGRPGWHIECSAMAEKELGPGFEIHGGGLDLVFPHHENERAQSLAAGRPFARIWMHNGMLRFTGEKMSKSLGNVATIREVLDEWGAPTALLFLATAHWRKPIDFSPGTMAAAAAQLETFRNAYVEPARAPADPEAEWERFGAALDDDFNTPDALGILHEWRAARHLELLTRGLAIFGIPPRETVVVDSTGGIAIRASAEPPEDVVRLVTDRHKARSAKDYAAADDLRARIEAAGWVVHDEAGGYRLEPR